MFFVQRGILMSATKEKYIILVAALLVAVMYIVAMMTLTGGHPLAPLDDTFIFLRYAKSLSKGQLFEYTPGAGYSTGSSSPLYPLLLAPFFWLGLDGVRMIAVTLGWGLVFLIGSSYLVRYLTVQWLPWREGGLLAALLLLFNGNVCWGFLSGMDAGLFAFLILLTLYFAHQWFEREKRHAFSYFLIALALLSIARPEGIALAGIAIIYFFIFALRRRISYGQWFGILIAAALLPCMYMYISWLFTGTVATNGMISKSIFYHPYYSFWDMTHTVAQNMVDTWSGYFMNIMPDEQFSWFKSTLFFPYFPPFCMLFFLIGLFYILKHTSGKQHNDMPLFWVLWFFGGLISLMFMQTIFAHNQRYFHPYIPLYFLTVIGGIYFSCTVLYPERPNVFSRAIVIALVVLSVPSLFYWAGEYGANCNDLYEQHRRMSWWVKDATPPDAVIGLTDTGLIPYYTGRRTFDFVGLVTNDMARWWRNGIGSAFEKMERLTAEQLPDIIITHPTVWGEHHFLGKPIYQLTLLDNSISIGTAMVVYHQEWSMLNSGSLPRIKHTMHIAGKVGALQLIDSMDVADLESEREHDYRWESDPERRSPDIWPFPGNLYSHLACPGFDGLIADGGREISGKETFKIHTKPNKTAMLVCRTDNASTVTLSVEIDGRDAGEWIIPPAGAMRPEHSQRVWHETEFMLPSEYIVGDSIRIQIRCRWSHISDADIHRSFHYWLFQPMESNT